MPDWKIRSMQAVWFLAGQTIQMPVSDVYRAIVGVAPSSTQTLPGGIHMANGTDGQSLCGIQLQPGRIDLSETLQSQAGAPISLFSDLSIALAAFRRRLSLGGGVAGNVVRLAVVVNVSEQTPTAEAATALILPKLGLSLPFQDASELIFQINRRAQMQSAPSFEMNRILKWLAETLQQFNVLGGFTLAQTINLATLSVDVNVIPRPGHVFAPAEQQPIFDEIAVEVERLCRANALTALL